MFSATFLFLLANFAFAASRVLVPPLSVVIDDRNEFNLKSSDGEYTLSSNHNTGFLKETVQEISPEDLQVNGEYKQTFIGPKSPVHLIVTYEAGRNGYVAKYRIWMTTMNIKALPAPVLKASAG